MALKAKVHCWYHWDELGPKFARIIDDELGSALSRRGFERVVVHDSNFSRVTPEKEKGLFCVFLTAYAHSRPEKGMVIPNKMWNFPCRIKSEGQSNYLYEPSGAGLVIIEPESEMVVAEVIGNNLYILFDLQSGYFTSSEKAREEILRAILREAVKLLAVPLPTLVDLVSGEFLVPEKSTLTTIRGKLAESRKTMAANISRLTVLEQQLEKLNLGNDASQVLQRIMNIPEVKAVTFDGNSMVIRTYTMYARDLETARLHEFGEFDITLRFGRDAFAKCRNKTTRPRDYGHPHVDRQYGQWCLGAGEGIMTLLRNFEFEAAILFALKAIESVNEIDGGSYLAILRLFPVVERADEEKALKRTKSAVAPSAEEKKAFAKIFNQSMGKAAEDLRESIAEVKKEIEAARGQLIAGVLAATLFAKMGMNNGRPDTAQGQLALSARMNEQFGLVRRLPEVKSVDVRGDLLCVETPTLTNIDEETRIEYLAGPFNLAFNFTTGEITVQSGRTTKLDDGRIFQCPQVPGKEGFFPLGQLTSTIPELFGSLELETMVTLTIQFLTSFDGSQVPPEVLEKQRRIRA